MKPSSPLRLCVNAVLFIFASLCASCTQRLTTETVYTDDHGTELVIEWPETASTNPDDYITTNIDGRTQTIAPLQP